MTKIKRIPISKETRFEVFKRDSFTCQYCGRSAPDVILNVDHIQPVAKDGDNSITNLITACFDCNNGKRDKELSDDSAIKKQKKMLDELQERRDQLQMMMQWQKSLSSLDEEIIDQACDYWEELTEEYRLTDSGREMLRKSIKRFGFQKVIEAMRTSVMQYAKKDSDKKFTPDSIQKAYEYIARICAAEQRNAEKPYMIDLYYIRGIIRNRFKYCVEWEALDLLEKAYLAGHDKDELRSIAKECSTWSVWRREMESLI